MRGLGALDERLAGRHAERAAHEAEILHGDGHRQLVDAAVADLEGVLLAGLGAGVLEAVGIALLVAELQRVGRDLRQGNVEPGAAIEHQLEALGRARCACGGSSRG